MSGSGTVSVPFADLASFAGAVPLTFTAIGSLQGSIDQSGVLPQDGGFYSYAGGTFTYLISDPVAAAIPEPGGWALSILGIGLIGAMARRRRFNHAGTTLASISGGAV